MCVKYNWDRLLQKDPERVCKFYRYVIYNLLLDPYNQKMIREIVGFFSGMSE